MEDHSQVFDVCVVCALPKEVKAFLTVVKPHCDGNLEERTSPRYGYSYRSGVLKNDKGELLNLHISWLPRYGPQEMIMHLSHVLEEYQPRIVIMTGICAGDSDHVRLGDLVVADRTFTYDGGKIVLDDQGRRVHLHDTLTYQPDANVVQFLGLFDDWEPLVAQLEGPPDQHKVACHIKPMASGSTVRADKPFQDVQVPVRDTVAIDMEGAAVGLVVSRYPPTRWLIVKGVCDYADQTKSDVYHDYAARASACYALRFIQVYVTNNQLSRYGRSSGKIALTQLQLWRRPRIIARRRLALSSIIGVILVLGVVISSWFTHQNIKQSTNFSLPQAGTSVAVTPTKKPIPTSSAVVGGNSNTEFRYPPWTEWSIAAPWSLSNDKQRIENSGMIASCDPDRGCDANEANKAMLFAPYSPEAKGMKNYAVQAEFEKVSCNNLAPAFMVFARGNFNGGGYGYIAGVAIDGSTHTYLYYGTFIGRPVNSRSNNERIQISDVKKYTVRLELHFSEGMVDAITTINGVSYRAQHRDADPSGDVGIVDYGCQIHVLNFQVSSL